MREIKFKAWDKAKHVFLSEDWDWCIDQFGNFCFTGEGGGTEPEAGYIIIQSTGLKDKNGREIYEGDILKRKSDIYKKTVVKWDKFRFIGIWQHKKCTVIGNIYEDPELLEGK